MTLDRLTQITSVGISSGIQLSNPVFVGVVTAGNTIVGGGTTQLVVNGNARITGILTIGTSSVTLDGTNNQVNVGSGVTIHHINGVQVGGNTVHSTGLTINQINVSGVITATNIDSIGVVTARSGIVVNSGGIVLVGSANSTGTTTQRLQVTGGAYVSGNLGIGTTNPSSTIDILGLQANTGSTSASLPTGTLKLGFDGGAVGGTYGSSLVFSQRWFSAASAQVAVGQIAGFKSGGDGNFGGGLAFFTSDTTNNNLAERLRITSTGTIGIGTSTPSNRVSIGVGTPATLNTTSEGLRVTDGLRNVQLLRTGSSYSYGGLGGTASLLYSYDSLFLQADTSNPIVFSTGSAETARITPAGLIQTPNNIGGGLDIGYKKSVTITGSFAANTWYNTGIDRTTDNGIYLLCAYVDTYNTGQSYQMNYIGWFVLPNRATNSGATSAITLHSAGHAPNAEVIQFRTLLEPAVSGGRIYLQWLSNFALTLNGGGGNNIQVAIHRLGTAFNS